MFEVQKLQTNPEVISNEVMCRLQLFVNDPLLVLGPIQELNAEVISNYSRRIHELEDKIIAGHAKEDEVQYLRMIKSRRMKFANKYVIRHILRDEYEDNWKGHIDQEGDEITALENLWSILINRY